MTLYAATATDPMSVRGWLFLAALAAVATLAYAGSCAWWPFAKCGRCEGSGKHTRADGRVWRVCHRCAGTGRRLRVGRRVHNYLAGRREAAK